MIQIAYHLFRQTKNRSSHPCFVFFQIKFMRLEGSTLSDAKKKGTSFLNKKIKKKLQTNNSLIVNSYNSVWILNLFSQIENEIFILILLLNFI